MVGQTETTASVGDTPRSVVKPGWMGRPLPGVGGAGDEVTGEVSGTEGEICIDLSRRPTSLMVGYLDMPEKTAEAMACGFYHTGDTATCDADGYLFYVGRTDDVVKASDHKISPFEPESVLVEHPAVLEAAVVPAPDPVRLAVPMAYVALAEGHEPVRETALAIFTHARDALAPL